MHNGHTAGPPHLADTGTDQILGCILCHMSLPVNTGKQHSLGIHSSLVHIHHTPVHRSWGGKYTDRLDRTLCQLHQSHHTDTPGSLGRSGIQVDSGHIAPLPHPDGTGSVLMHRTPRTLSLCSHKYTADSWVSRNNLEGRLWVPQLDLQGIWWSSGSLDTECSQGSNSSRQHSDRSFLQQIVACRYTFQNPFHSRL